MNKKHTNEQRFSFVNSLYVRTRADYLLWEPLDFYLDSFSSDEEDLKKILNEFVHNEKYIYEPNKSFFYNNDNCYIFAVSHHHPEINERRCTLLLSNEFHYPMVFVDSYNETSNKTREFLFMLFDTIKDRYDFWLELDLGERGPLGTTVRRLLSE